MKLTETIYQISGIPFGNNSNTYVIDAGDELVLIDTGYSAAQWATMKKVMAYWGLQNKPITHAFLTHAHFDHAGNAHRCRAEGSKLVVGVGDAEAIETCADGTLCNMFEGDFVPCKVDIVASDGDVFSVGNTKIKVIGLPGHSKGALGFQVCSGTMECLFIGDFFSITSASPEDEVNIDLGWTGGPDYDREQNLASFRRAAQLQVDAILPGHLTAFFGDCRKILEMAYKKAAAEL